MDTYEEIEDAALSLPPQARATLIDHLVESLDPEAQKRVEAYWIQVAERRAREMEDGTVTPIPGEEVMSRLRSRYKR